MNTDKGIIYMGKLQNIRKSLAKLKALGFNTEKLENNLSKLETEVETKITDIYDKLDREDSQMFLHDSISSLYAKALKRLDKINYVIEEEYNLYYIINAQYELLKIELQEFTSDNIESLVKKTVELLLNIKSSSNIDYNMKKDSVEKIYALIYKVIKLELIYSNESTLFDLVKSDETDCSFLVLPITNNINEIPEEERKKIYKIRKELEIEDINDSSLVSKKLIQAIIEAEENNEISDKRFQDLANEYSEQKRNLLSAKQSFDLAEEMYKKSKENKNKKYCSLLRKKIFGFVNSTLIFGGILVNAWVLKENITESVYKEYKTTYDSSTGKTTTEEGDYSKDVPNVTITEYSPWDSPGYFRDDYQRTKYIYKFKDNTKVILENPQDYLEVNLKDILEFEDKKESQPNLPDDYGYHENKYIIVKISHDLSDSVEQTAKIPFTIVFTLTSLGLFGLGALVEALLFKTSKEERKKGYLNAKSEFKEAKNKILEEQERLKEATFCLEQLEKKVDDEYNKLPTKIKDKPKVKQKYLLLKEKNNS